MTGIAQVKLYYSPGKNPEYFTGSPLFSIDIRRNPINFLCLFRTVVGSNVVLIFRLRRLGMGKEARLWALSPKVMPHQGCPQATQPR